MQTGSIGAIGLIAEREISTRLRTKAFRVTTGVVLGLIVLSVVAFHLLGRMNLNQVTVGLVAADSSTAQTLEAAGSTVGADISARTIASEASGRAEVADGSIDALVTVSGQGIHVVVAKKLDPGLRGVLTVFAQKLVLDGEIRSLGGDPTAVGMAVAQAVPTVETLLPEPAYNPQRLTLGAMAGILIYLSLLIGGQMVAQGVVEEKSSRVIELLLATVKPWQLMTGKVLGLGALGLIQVVAYGVVGVGLAIGLGTLTISLGASIGAVVWLIVWYLVGFVLFAYVFAGAGALVSRQEDAAGVIMPITTVVIIGYVVGITILPSDPSNSFAGIMSMIPVFAPTMMPMRLAMGGVPVWETLLSLALALASIPALALLAGRIYRNAVIHIGSRMPLRKALAK